MNSFPFAGSSRTVGESSSRNSTSQLEISNGTLLGRILRRTSSARHIEPIRALEEVIDLDRNLDLYRTNQANLLNPRTLYQTGPLNLRTSLLRINREEQVNVTTEVVNLSIIIILFSTRSQTTKRFIILKMTVFVNNFIDQGLN